MDTGTFRIRSVSADGDRVVFGRAWPPARVGPFLGTGDPAPALPPETIDGAPISLSDYRGREVLLLFWTPG